MDILSTTYLKCVVVIAGVVDDDDVSHCVQSTTVWVALKVTLYDKFIFGFTTTSGRHADVVMEDGVSSLECEICLSFSLRFCFVRVVGS